MNRVAIIDYGMCNLDSVRRAVEKVGGSPYVVADGTDLAGPDRILLPGVGSFADAMDQITRRGLGEAMTNEVVGAGIPLLGICLGMQLLTTRGTEGGEVEGLGWVDATVVRLSPTDTDHRIPHMGWNEVDPVPGATLFHDIDPGSDFYFVHSYHVTTTNPDDVAATTPYCGGFTSAIEHGSVFGMQFHPEKSQQAGFQVLRNFLEV